MHKEAHLIE